MTPSLSQRIDARIADLTRDRTVERIWAGDHSVWKPEPTEIVDRLGWLRVANDLRHELPELEAFARAVVADGFKHVLLLGMGGSSLGPEVLRETFGAAPGMLDLVVLDSTHPQQVRETEARLDLARTLVLVASKSGTTIETLSHLDYFWDRVESPEQFVAITDPGSSLAILGRERGFRRVFENRPDIGGRYSVLSHFGMVPAALIGAPVRQILDDAIAIAEQCAATIPTAANPGVALGVALAEAALQGLDKCTLVLPESMKTLGWWIEQLVAESTGKEGRGILPVEGEPVGPVAGYGSDRVFVTYEESPRLRELESAGHPVIQLADAGIGGEFFRWEFATAIAGAVLQVQPFDQPNVQEAKDAAGIILAGGVPDVMPINLRDLLGTVEPGDYIAINAFISRNEENGDRLDAVRRALARRHRVAVTVGYGPRFLHSTGQLHKGGPPSGAFIEVIDSIKHDIAIPGRPYTFGQLLQAQALGDLAALLGRDRRACRVHLEDLEAVAL